MNMNKTISEGLEFFDSLLFSLNLCVASKEFTPIQKVTVI